MKTRDKKLKAVPIPVRLTYEEVEKVTELAKKCNGNKSEAIRQCIKRARVS